VEEDTYVLLYFSRQTVFIYSKGNLVKRCLAVKNKMVLRVLAINAAFLKACCPVSGAAFSGWCALGAQRHADINLLCY